MDDMLIIAGATGKATRTGNAIRVEVPGACEDLLGQRASEVYCDLLVAGYYPKIEEVMAEEPHILITF